MNYRIYSEGFSDFKIQYQEEGKWITVGKEEKRCPVALLKAYEHKHARGDSKDESVEIVYAGNKSKRRM